MSATESPDAPPEADHLRRQHAPYDDEISLYDLWNVLVRQRLLIAAVLVLTLVAAATYILLTPATYDFRSGIDIGYVYRGESAAEDRYRPVASAAAAQARLSDVVIPDVSRQRGASGEGPARDVDVELSEADNTLVITTSAPADAAQEVAALHTAIAAALAEHHQPYFQRERSLVIEQLQVQASVLEQELAADQQQLELLGNLDFSAVGQPGVVALVNAQRLSDLRRGMAEKRGALAHLKATIGSVQDASRGTRMSFIASQSKERNGAGASLVLALALVLGLMVGFFVAFIREFAVNAREQRESALRPAYDLTAPSREQPTSARHVMP